MVADAVLLAALDAVAEPEAATPEAPDAPVAEAEPPLDAAPTLLLPSGAHSFPLHVVWA